MKYKFVLVKKYLLCALVVRVPGCRTEVLLDFLRSSGSGTGSTQPREYN
jgi:hypothetical protein